MAWCQLLIFQDLIQTPMFPTPISNHFTFPYKLAEQPIKSYIFLVIGKSDPLLRNLTNRNASALSWYKLRKFGISLRLHLPLDRSVNSFHLFRGFITHQRSKNSLAATQNSLVKFQWPSYIFFIQTLWIFFFLLPNNAIILPRHCSRPFPQIINWSPCIFIRSEACTCQ